jgi:hypothetical protein
MNCNDYLDLEASVSSTRKMTQRTCTLIAVAAMNRSIRYADGALVASIDRFVLDESIEASLQFV